MKYIDGDLFKLAEQGEFDILFRVATASARWVQVLP